jgi:hypothetical protein
MPLTQAERDLAVGKLIREERDAHERRAYLDAELSDAATAFRRAATQIECLLADNRSCVSPAMSKINMKHIVALLAEREVLQRKIHAAHAELQRLRAEDR